MASREDLELTSLVIGILGMVFCAAAVGLFFGNAYGFLFLGLPLLAVGIYGMVTNPK